VNPSDPADSPPSRPLAPSVADWMLLIVALALVAGLVKRHTSDPTMNFRLVGHPPASVWTRLLLGHFMTGTGLVFGLSRLWVRLRQKTAGPQFGLWLWSAVGLYLFFYITASTAWSSVNFVRAAWFSSRGASGTLADLVQMLSLVAVMSSVQACFDSFAWFLAAIRAALALGADGESAERPGTPGAATRKADITIALYSALVISSTTFQRVLESCGF